MSSPPQDFDVVILGAGMAGSSLAGELAADCRVALVEVEDQPGRHATGRSAAMFFESYGNATIRALTRASRSLLEHPPGDFAERPLMSPRDTFLIAAHDQRARLDELGALPDGNFVAVDRAEVLRRVPILRPEWLAGALLDAGGQDIDVAALHQAWLRKARRGGAALVLDAGEVAL